MCGRLNERLRSADEMTVAPSHIEQLGEESSVWFKLTPLLKGPNNPLHVLMQMADRYGGVIPVDRKSVV